jgi:hypothetical protein
MRMCTIKIYYLSTHFDYKGCFCLYRSVDWDVLQRLILLLRSQTIDVSVGT